MFSWRVTFTQWKTWKRHEERNKKKTMKWWATKLPCYSYLDRCKSATPCHFTPHLENSSSRLDIFHLRTLQILWSIARGVADLHLWICIPFYFPRTGFTKNFPAEGVHHHNSSQFKIPALLIRHVCCKKTEVELFVLSIKAILICVDVAHRALRHMTSVCASAPTR